MVKCGGIYSLSEILMDTCVEILTIVSTQCLEVYPKVIDFHSLNQLPKFIILIQKNMDPKANTLLANENHIKVAHGKDYTDCPPLKGVVYSTGKNKTSHSVEVSSQQ